MRNKLLKLGTPGKHAFLLLLSTVTLFPLYLMAVMAFSHGRDIIGRGQYLVPPVLNPALENFTNVFEAAPLFTFLGNSIFVVLAILVLQLLLIIPAAYVFARVKFKYSGILFGLYVIQIMLPLDLLIVPNYRIMSTFGLIDTRIAMVLPFVGSGYCCFLLRQAFKQVPQAMEDCAVMDGCGPIRFIWHVLIPLCRPALTVFSLISIAIHWNDYLWPLIITNSPRVRTLTIGLGQFVKQEAGADWGMLMAATLFMVLPVIVLFAVTQKAFIENFLTSGLKG